ncbi:hypothetical protein AwDysgo_06000 [Bacteroidales bacterium]|nr:hypothetical protein AwDysgo_06000 [Bacteroidales bacterium]
MVKNCIYYILTIIFFFTCCKKKDDPIPLEKEVVRVHFLSNALQSKQTENESKIKQAQALIFVHDGNEYKYQYKAIATAITEIETHKTNFEVVLQIEAKPVKIYVLANADLAIANNLPRVGESETEVKSKITQEFGTQGRSTEFPMWGELLLNNGTSTILHSTIIPIKTLRSKARIDVIAEDVVNDFTLVSIQAFRANSMSQIIPNTYKEPLFVEETSIPLTSMQTINTEAISISQISSVAQLYLPETDAPPASDKIKKACCIIVGGLYKGGSEPSYYRLDVETNDPAFPLGKILRNHQYTFNISKVENVGWPSPEEAANNQSIDIQASIADWIELENELDFDGEYYFRVSSRTATLSDTIGSEASILVSSNIFLSDCSIQWARADGSPTSLPSISLDNGIFRVEESQRNLHIVALTAKPSGSGIREAYVLINAKRIKILIKIIQTDQ